MPKLPIYLLLLLSLFSCSTSVEKRGDVLGERIAAYWTGTEIDSLSDENLEQKIVDYIYLMSHAPDSLRADGWEHAAMSVARHPRAAVVFLDYLGNPESPMHNDPLLTEFIDHTLPHVTDPRLTLDMNYLRTQLALNSPGSVMSDLNLTVDGRPSTMLDETARRDTSIVLFYLHDCESCGETIRRLSDRENVIAVSVDMLPRDLPEAWTSALPADEEQLDSTFYFPTLPALYIVDRSGMVIHRE